MVADPTRRNRLDDAASPYLLEHADNPVHWQPWDDAAVRAARERDVPIFLSIGYAACHWCHVMADESFADADVASRLNERYVPIKVDREERPDLDHFYQAAGQVTGGGGGWPLSAWLTPDGRPFQLATYLPPTARDGMPGFTEVLDAIAEAWETDRSAIEARADEITEAVRSRQAPRPTGTAPPDGAGTLERVAGDLLRLVDHEHGGFQSAGPKFPQVPRLRVMLTAWRTSGRDALGDAVSTTLEAMVDGGLYDHVGGGFHRYVTDPAWRVPHFEKMLYDNAALLGLLAEAAVALDEDRYARVADETVRFIRDDLRLDAGGLACSLDADTAGEEGLTYVWTPEDVEAAIDDRLTRSVVAARFGVDGPAEVAGGRVLRVQRSRAELATEHDLTPAEVDRHLAAGLAALRSARADRPQPRRDEKVIAAWNGLAVAGLARAGALLDEDAYLTLARDTLDFVADALHDPDDGQLWRRYRDGDVGVPGFLEDFAAVATGAFELYAATGSPAPARLGLSLVDAMLDRCWDGERGALRFSQLGTGGAPVDALDARDRSQPSAMALAVDALATADGLREDDRTRAVVDWVRDTHGPAVDGGGADRAALVLALDRWANGPPSVTVSGAEVPDGWRGRLLGHPRRPVVTHRPPDADLAAAVAALGLDERPPLWRDRPPVEGEPTLYACRGRTCGPPATDIEAALAWFEEHPAGGGGLSVG